MLIGLLTTLLVIDGIFLILIVLLQKGKGGVGLAGMGGGAQMLFGGSGGQDLFQKITWVLGAIFMAGSLLLAIMKSQTPADFSYKIPAATQQQAPLTPGKIGSEQSAPIQQPIESSVPSTPAQ